MRRFVVGLVLGLFLAAAYVTTGQVVPGNLPVLTDQHAFVVAHISSVSHVVLVGTSGGSVPISTVSHITSVVHIQVSGAGSPTSSLSVRCVNTGGTAFADCGGGASSGDAVNVFHQSTVRHISSVTHMAGALSIVDRAGNYVGVTGGELNVTCTGCSAASVVAVSHVSGAVHIAGTIRGAAFHIQGLGTPGASHGGVLSVQGVGGGNAIPASQSGTWTVQPGNTVNTSPWMVNIAHISGAVHLASNVTDNANNAIRVTGVTFFSVQGAISHNSGQLHVAGLGISPQFTMFRVNCGSSAATAVSVTTTRRRVILQNVGTLPIYIGGGHVTVTTSNAFTLHAVSAAQNAATTSRLELTDFQGRVDCISEGPGQTLEVLQVIGGR